MNYRIWFLLAFWHEYKQTNCKLFKNITNRQTTWSQKDSFDPKIYLPASTEIVVINTKMASLRHWIFKSFQPELKTHSGDPYYV